MRDTDDGGDGRRRKDRKNSDLLSAVEADSVDQLERNYYQDRVAEHVSWMKCVRRFIPRASRFKLTDDLCDRNVPTEFALRTRFRFPIRFCFTYPKGLRKQDHPCDQKCDEDKQQYFS